MAITLETGIGERAKYGFIEETTLGTKPAGNLKELWCNRFNFPPRRGQFQSGRALGDHQLDDFRLGRHSPAGDIMSELCFTNHDLFLEAVLMTTKNASPFTAVTAGTISFTAPATITDSGSGLGSVSAGDFIYVSGADTSTNNGLFKVATAAAGSLTVEGDGIATETPSGDITIRECEIVNGTTYRSFTIQEHRQDLDLADWWHGVFVTGAALTVPADGIVSMSWSVIARKWLDDQTAETTYDTPADERPFDGLNGAWQIGTIVAPKITSLNLSINNSAQYTAILGDPYGDEPIPQKEIITGDMSVLHTGTAYSTYFINETEFKLIATLQDPDGNQKVLILPRCVLTDYSKPKEGDGPFVERVPFQALKDKGASDVTIAICDISV
jgi:hypothetical protein